MKSSFIKVFLSAKNEFRTNMDLVFNGTEYKKVDVKIDTGCGYSSFPVCKLGISPSDAYAMKLADSNDSAIKKSISFGVNDSKNKRDEDKKKFKNKLYMDLNSVTFQHSIEKIVIDGYAVGDCSIRISYDRTGNILLGMDILKMFDIHIGTDKDGETVLIACLKDDLSDEYIKELDSLVNYKRVN